MHGRQLTSLRPHLPAPILAPLPKPIPTHLSSRRITSIPHPQHDPLESRLMSILRSCSAPHDLQMGRQAHAQFIVHSIGDAGLGGSRILGMYVLCGSLQDAKDVFFRVDRGCPSPWNWMIRGFSTKGGLEFALLLYFKMQAGRVVPDKYTFPLVIKVCRVLSAIELGRVVHETVRLMSLETDVHIASSLIKMYAECGSVVEARRVFDKMPQKDCILWNVMIYGYVRSKDVNGATDLFNKMRCSGPEPNYVSFVSALSICASEAMLQYGTQLHSLAIRCGVDSELPIANTLLSMYSKCRCWSSMSKLFEMTPEVETVTWNVMISGYVQNGLMDEALDAFYNMQSMGVKPDSVTFASLLPAFSEATGLKQGKAVQAYIMRNGVYFDAFLKSALINVYLKCRNVEMAHKIFEGTGIVDVVICSAMISGYVLNGKNFDALELFRMSIKKNIKPNAVTVASILPACSCLAALILGRELHVYAFKNGLEGICYVGSALMDMYAKCGRLDLGHLIFMRMSERDSIAWNSMISSFAQNSEPEEAINLFRKMGLEGIAYDSVSISSALSACANLPALHRGKEIHGLMMRGALRSDLFIDSALIDMYAKCGELVFAHHVFDFMQNKNEVSWNSIIAAYGVHGRVKEAEVLFGDMQRAGFQPDQITFLSMISACAHSGQVEEGFQYFKRMTEEFGFLPRMEHYAAMVDLFGRAGLLNEALQFIKNMPYEADTGIWGALIGSCRVYRNVELADLAAKHLFQLDPQNSGYYVLLSNTRALAGRWDGVLKVRRLMKDKGVLKSPGCSWVDINSATHMFVAEDKRHIDSDKIYFYLEILYLELKKEGYTPQSDFTCTDMEANVNSACVT